MIGARSIALALGAALLQPAFAGTFDVITINFNYSPALLTIRAGDTVRFQAGPFHPLRFDDGRPGCDADCAIRFDVAGEYPYFCLQHGGPAGFGMSGVIRVEGGPAPFAISQGIAGAWFEPATAGQGFLIDIDPASRLIFVAWFTYAPAATSKVGAPEHRWLSAQGSYQNDRATIPIFATAGGAFDTPRPTTTTQVGEMSLVFANCNAATVAYSIPVGGLTGEIAIQRLLPVDASRCQSPPIDD